MYLIRYNKKSKPTLLTEKYHIADANGITQLVDNYMSDFINHISKIRKGWTEPTPTFSIVNLTDRTNPCRDWLGNDTVVHYISRKERNIDNENKGWNQQIVDNFKYDLAGRGSRPAYPNRIRAERSVNRKKVRGLMMAPPERGRRDLSRSSPCSGRWRP